MTLHVIAFLAGVLLGIVEMYVVRHFARKPKLTHIVRPQQIISYDLYRGPAWVQADLGQPAPQMQRTVERYRKTDALRIVPYDFHNRLCTDPYCYDDKEHFEH